MDWNDKFFEELLSVVGWLRENGNAEEAEQIYKAFGAGMPTEVFHAIEDALQEIQPKFAKYPVLNSRILGLLKEIDDMFRKLRHRD